MEKIFVNIERMRLFVIWLEIQKDRRELILAKERELLNGKLAESFGVNTSDAAKLASGRNFEQEEAILNGRYEELDRRASKLDSDTPDDQRLTVLWWKQFLPHFEILSSSSTELADFKREEDIHKILIAG